MPGVKIDDFGNIPEVREEQIKQENCNPLVDNMKGFIGFRLDRNFGPLFIEGEIEELTGYSKEDLLSGRAKCAEIIVPEYMPYIQENIQKLASNQEHSIEIEYRIRRKDGEIKWVTQVFQSFQRTPERPEIYRVLSVTLPNVE